jgi:hypothetical protein
MEDIIMNSGYGRPSLYKLQQKYKKICDISIIDDSFLGKEVIIIYKYINKLYGNWHQDVLYHGVLSQKPANTSSAYDDYICVNHYKSNKIFFIRKARFNKNLDLFILN